MDGDVELDSATASEFGGANYSSLPDALSDAFDDYEIECDVISDASDEDVKEFFQRLQAGLPLTSSEKLNSIHSRLRDFCAKLAKHDFFPESTMVANRRHGYFDICSKVVALEIEGIDSGLRFDDVSAVFNANTSFSTSSAVAKRVKSSLDALRIVFPTKTSTLRQRSMIQSVVTLVCHLKVAGLTDAQMLTLRAFLDDFSSELQRQVELGPGATDQDFIAFQRTVNANTRSGARQRHEILLRKLFSRHPGFYSQLSTSKEVQAGITGDVNRHAELTRELIASINDRYAATTGRDLFKPTNKTVGALTGLNRTISSVDDYKAWVETLYFLFRESVGQRLDGVWPSSFADVNDLRTALQHDVDHGKGAPANRKKLAGVFSKYSGSSSTPEALAPELFQLVQANILGAIAFDLQALAKRYS